MSFGLHTPTSHTPPPFAAGRAQLPRWAVVGSALVLACSLANAQATGVGPAATPSTQAATAPAATPEGGLTKGEIKAQREFKMLDFNGDGKLSRTEVKLFPRLAAAFDDADTDRDGYVSYEEVRVFAAKYRAERDRQKAEQAAAAGAAAAPAPARK
ncbi:EF-hand domain-containing protein [Acidovorax sp.]|uniref:EF-hand domain-containing protein n=1 Tax=Acidovorax sp. TaxID=1872122 RepID=UPI003918E133